MNTITSQQASDVISDDYQTSSDIVDAVSEEAVEDYVEVTSVSSDEDDILNYGAADTVNVQFDSEGRDGAASAIAGLSYDQQHSDAVQQRDDISKEDIRGDLGTNWAVAYATEVVNQTLEVTDGDVEAVNNALDQAYDQMEQALDRSTTVFLGTREDASRSKDWPDYVSNVEETLEDFQDEVGEMLG